MVAGRLADMPDHRPDNKGANLRTSRTEAAEKLNVSERSVTTAKKVQTQGTEELQGKVSEVFQWLNDTLPRCRVIDTNGQ